MADWVWVLGGPPTAGNETRQLTQAYGRNLTMRVDAPFTAQFSIDGRSDEAAQIAALATDLHIYRDGIKYFRGRITTESDAVDESKHGCQFTAIDYRGMLAHRIIGTAGRTFAATDQGTIAWTLIQESQALTSGDWGITNGVGATSGTVRDRIFDPGKPLLDVINELFRVENGGEWEIAPTLALNRWYPRRGTAGGVVLDYGGKISTFSRLLQPGNYANYTIATGSTGLAPASAVSGTIATDPRGRWELAQGFPSIIEQATVTTKANWMLSEANTLRPEIRITFASGRWGGTGDVGLGDTVVANLRSGRLIDSTSQRVVEIVCVPGDDGTETISMGLVAA